MPLPKPEPDKLIPLRKFAKPGVYTPAYLSQLVQRKRLRAQRIGRNYYTTQTWFDEYLSLHARDCKQNGYAEAAAPSIFVPAWKIPYLKHRASVLVALVFVCLIGAAAFVFSERGRVAGVLESATSTATNIDEFITDFHESRIRD